ncbi:hypothetical protein DB30_03398 [Enhygromyxa salina]|uniref:Uncharacterized protein n=1 Tax=Enhygromyxa salina TaxID=215803 RepID=A0A0C2D255_9BACT|nr:hypothetical protein DB30_03398 [Enhygromyxa salina]
MSQIRYETDEHLDNSRDPHALTVLVLDSIVEYQWDGDRITRTDRFNADGSWDSTWVYTWVDDLLRVDSISADYRDTASLGTADDIYQRKGPSDYVPLFSSPNEHWEYSTANGVETVTKFAGELPIERKRFEVVDGYKRTLTVERILPEVLGLAMVEVWDWSVDGRAVVNRHDGREVILFDCSNEPPIESLIHPNAPPPARPVQR